MSADEWVWVWQADGGDYYAGESGALYQNGVLIWHGSSYDEGDQIAKAVLGDQLSVKRIKTPFRAELKGGHFHDLLEDTLRDAT